MANKFEIVITAVDKVTATARKINASIDRLTRPVVAIRQSVTALGKEMGFDKVGKSVAGVSRAAGDLAGKLTALIAPLAAVIGTGSIVGTAALAMEWARLGAEVSRTAEGLGMAAGDLMALRGAAQAAGVSSEELTAGLKSVGDTLEDALFGRNQAAMAMLNRLGIGIHKTKDGSIDAARGVKELATAIAGIKNVQAQGLVARTFGVESLLPLLRQGAAGIEEYEKKVAQLGGVHSQAAIEAAAKFGLQLNYLNIATHGVRDAIGERLLPILAPLLERFTAWIVANRDLIATKVAEFVEGLAHWVDNLDFNRVADDIAAFGKKVEDVVESLGGWKNAAIAVVLVLNAGLIASVVNLGAAIVNLSVVAVPAAIRAVGLLAAGLGATLVPAIAGAMLQSALFFESLAAMTAGAPLVSAALGAVSTGFLSVGAAIAATPIGWLIAGAAAIAVAVYAIYKNWDNITAYFAEKWAGIKAAFSSSWTEGILKVLMEFSPVKLIADAMNGLTKWLFDFDLYEAGRNIVAGLVRGMKSLASLLPKSIQKLIGVDSWAVQTSAQTTPATPSAPPARPAPAASAVPSVATGPAVATPMPGSRDPIGIRQNNPGNLRSWAGVPTVDGFAKFSDPAAGIAAMAKNLQAYQEKYGINTLSGIVNRWAPPSENNTPAYIADMAKRTGFRPDEKLNLNDPKVVAPLVSGIIHHENGRNPYSQQLIDDTVADQLAGRMPRTPAAAPAPVGFGGAESIAVEVTFKNAPVGTTASAKTKEGRSVPVRVNYAMSTAVAA